MAETDDDGYAWPDADAPHPEVVRRISYTDIWPADEPFPLNPLEAWYLLQGWEVAPAAGVTGEQVMKIPAKAEGGNGWIVLWRS
jgi:hypothetical protein